MNRASDVIEAFVPKKMLVWVGDETVDGVPGRRIEAVVLFCDISSFTTVANRLVEQGRDGLGTLRSALNSTFDTWITSIHAHGGSVARFVGDAIVAVWRITDASQYDAAIGSAKAAADAIIRGGVDNLSVAGVQIAGKFGVGVGVLDVMSISVGVDQRELAVDGDALRRAVEASSLGKANVVELDDGRTHVFGSKDADLGRISQDVIALHVPGAIRDRLAVGHGDWLGELRLVSIMFVGLPDVQGPRQVQEAVDNVTVNVPLSKQRLFKINVDDKGLGVMVVFGAPASHDDDAVQALTAALSISEALSTAAIRHSIGLASGRAFCGSIGNDSRRDYNLTGHVANLASRLMSAQMGVLVDAATVGLSAGRFELVDVQEQLLKGIEQSVKAGRPKPVDDVLADDQLVLVGRSAERQAIDELILGEYRTLVVKGEAGMGKSTLARYAAGMSTDRGWLVIKGSSSVVGEANPYEVWQRSLRLAFGADEIRATAGRLSEADAWFADRRPLVAALSHDVIEETMLTLEMSGAVRAENARGALLRLIHELIGDRRVLFIFEDAQWFDSASWALLGEAIVGDHLGSVLINLRPNDPSAHPELSVIESRLSTRVLELGDMTPEDVEELLKVRFDVDEVPAQIVSRMIEAGAASPLFAEQLAYALLEAGEIRVMGRKLSVADSGFASSVLLTDTLEAILTSRIDQSPQSAQLTLKVASVIGLEFELETLEAVHPVAAREVVESDTTVLEAERLVRQMAKPPETAFEFWHRLTRDVAYQLLPGSERTVLHERVARWLTNNDESATPGVVAQHYLAAEKWRPAAVYLERAATEARRSHSNAETVHHLSTLRALATDGRAPAPSRDIARWLRFEGDALMALGRYVEARQTYKQALDIWGYPFADGRFGQAGGLVRNFGALLRPPKQSDSAEEIEGTTESALILPLLAQMAYFDQDLPQLIYANLTAVRLAEISGDPGGLARAHGAWSIAAGLSGMQRLARRSDKRSLAEASRDGGLQAVGYANLLHGILHYARGNWHEAERGFTTALASYRRLGAIAESDTTNLAFSFLELFRGDAEALLRQLDETSPNPSNQVALWSGSGRIIGHMLTGRPVSDQMVAELEHALDAPRLEKGDALLGSGVVALVGVMRRETGRMAEALGFAKKWLVGLPAATAYTGFGLYGIVLAGLAVAEAPVDGWNRRQARKIARRAARHLRVVGIQNPVIRPLARLAAAHIARMPVTRRWHHRRALGLAERFGTAYVEPLHTFSEQFLSKQLTVEEGINS